MDRTTCVACGLESGYNRVVVSLPAETTVGGLCRECEAVQFGEVLARAVHRGDECALCRRDGLFALPTWEPFTTDEAGDRVVRSRYEITASTPALCDEDYHEFLASEEPTASARTASPGSRP
jgi:hypothetical protein